MALSSTREFTALLSTHPKKRKPGSNQEPGCHKAIDDKGRARSCYQVIRWARIEFDD
jgi:hypothetical protein